MKTRATWSINGRFLTQPQTGVQRYAGEMTREIDAWLARDEDFARKLAFEICLPADCDAPPSFANIPSRRSGRGRGHAWEQVVLPAMARDGLLSFANLGPIAHGRQIICLHDANTYLAPESYARSFRLAYRTALPLLARRAQAVTTVSTFSARMLQQFGVTAGKPARVIHNGHEHALRWDRTRSRFDVQRHFKRPFVFALGSRAKHKQLDLLLGLAPALDALGLDLIVSGGTASIFAEAALTQTVNVFPVGFVSDDDLASLFAQATCFAFPSRTEGFGIPLVEAMVHGAPIVSSDCASMPEVCGDAAIYAAADDPAAWLAQITRLAQDARLRDDLRAKGKARYRLFSWREGARAYLDLALALSSRTTAAPGGARARLLGGAS